MNKKIQENVVILGASDKSDRYAYKANQMLKEHGHNTYLVHPTLQLIENQKVFHHLSDVNKKIDTLTVYVNPSISSNLEKDILALNPKRVIFNPGAENPTLSENLKKNNIYVENACTLVLLSTNQY